MWIRIGIKDIGLFKLEEEELNKLKNDFTNYLKNVSKLQAGGIYHYVASKIRKKDGILFLKFEEIAYIS
jgi:hypothetical protein